jgi:cytochrome c oxidase assembly protein subunit 15
MKRTFRKVAKIALILVYIVIIAGAVVRMTGSGMGCPDWPKCFGYYIPPTNAETLQWQPNRDFKKGQAIIKDSTLWIATADFRSAQIYKTKNWEMYTKHDYAEFNVWHTWIEYINRLVTVILGIPMIVLLILSLFLFKTDKKLTYITILTLIVLAVQALLGKIVVDTNLKTGMITVHMVIAFVLIALLLLVIYRSGNQNNILEKLNPSIKNLILITTVITLLQVILGTQVREFIDQQIDLLGEQSKNLWLQEPALKFYVHRSFSIVIIALNLILAVKMVRIYPHYKKIKWVMIFILLSVLTGIAMNYADFPFASQPLHLVLAALLFGVQFYMVLEGIMPFKSHKTS